MSHQHAESTTPSSLRDHLVQVHGKQPTSLRRVDWPALVELHDQDHRSIVDLAIDARSTAESWDHPAHYGGKDNPYEAIKVIEAWGLDFCLGNTVKYISRAGKKDAAKEVEDLEKARWYIDRRIQQLRGKA